DSQRLPRKALLRETGRPLFLHTWEAATRARCFTEVLIATDHDEVDAAARAAGASVVRTSPRCRTGSERCAEAAKARQEPLVVDSQGDWPEVLATDLERLVEALAEGVASGTAPTATLARPLAEHARIQDPNVVKVVQGLRGEALYFSRCPIPYKKRVEDGVP